MVHLKKKKKRDFPGCSVVKILPSSVRGAGSISISDQEAKIPYALWPENQNRIFFLKLNFILKKVGNKDVKTLTMNLESTCFFFFLLSCVSQIFYNTNVIVDFMCPNI